MEMRRGDRRLNSRLLGGKKSCRGFVNNLSTGQGRKKVLHRIRTHERRDPSWCWIAKDASIAIITLHLLILDRPGYACSIRLLSHRDNRCIFSGFIALQKDLIHERTTPTP
jgi:hypothetical protein